MEDFFEPYVSYRLEKSGGGIRDFWLVSGGGLFTRHRTVLFLVHGYNNPQDKASQSYQHFVARLGKVFPSIVGVYWPGDNWTGGAYYIEALERAKVIAGRFARDIHLAAAGSGGLAIVFAAHSLGCRLALETIRALSFLLQTQPIDGLTVSRTVLMAGAVPTYLLKESKDLNLAVRALSVSTKSLYSKSDRVLHYAFPLGESLAGEGFFPTALGRKKWDGSNAVVPTMEQVENDGANHSDYWGGTSSNSKALSCAASEVRAFLPTGGLSTPARETATRASPGGRSQEDSRETPNRAV